MNPSRILALVPACLLVLLPSCGDDSNRPSAAGDPSASSSKLPADLLVTAPPEGAVSVVAARAAAEPGQPIVLRGRVGGKSTPLPEGAALLVLADEKAIVACSDVPGDSCPTPWDYCCEESSKIASATATVQVRDKDGDVLRTPLRGLGNLKELSTLVVSGIVDEASTQDALIVNATAIHVEKP